ncbi:MAG TPA: 50S ribosomal protein L13 [Candidatus Nanoarchaeia archaeon]|nr:50S ribosomal protein L13 [Candidatus Nanoarchaeia archaeon]
MEINIDATNGIAGRIASYAAKQALLGHTVNIFNSERAIISGSPSAVREKYYHRIFKTGQPNKGPFISRMPDRFLRRIVRGMVEHKQGRGGEAFERIMCYIGVPVAFKDKKLVHVAKKADELPSLKYQTIGQLCVSLGGRV